MAATLTPTVASRNVTIAGAGLVNTETEISIVMPGGVTHRQYVQPSAGTIGTIAVNGAVPGNYQVVARQSGAQVASASFTVV